jgi:hypothetical protein
LLTSAASAQTTGAATIVGTVTDTTGAVIPGVTNHRLKAVAGVTDCKSCSGQRPAGWVPHQAGFKK